MVKKRIIPPKGYTGTISNGKTSADDYVDSRLLEAFKSFENARSNGRRKCKSALLRKAIIKED